MEKRQIGHRKSCLVLSTRFPVANLRFRPVAKSSHYRGCTVSQKRERNGIIASVVGARTGKFELLSRKLIKQGRADKG